MSGMSLFTIVNPTMYGGFSMHSLGLYNDVNVAPELHKPTCPGYFKMPSGSKVTMLAVGPAINTGLE